MAEIIHKISDNKYPIDLVVLSQNNISTSKKFLTYLYNNTPLGEIHLIWVDNGSDDGTVDFLKKISVIRDDISLLLEDNNLGVIGGRNRGYEFAKNRKQRGEFLMFLDNDQYVQKDWLQQHYDFLHKGGYDLVGIEAWQMNNLFMPVKKINKKDRYYNYVGCGGMLMKNKVPDDIGMFDERFNPAYFEDPDFNIQSYNAGYKIGWNEHAKIVHFPHQTLGALPSQEKAKRFGNSIRKFREKWKGHSMPIIQVV